MCGIAGFSLSKDSTIKVRQLSNALLTAIEDRGYMAAGFAWQTSNAMGVYKQATTGSTLSLKSMPKQARNVILHTRLATHGAVTDNRNNHPVMSPSDDIALVHNGVIYNHHSVRKQVAGDLPPVDTSVIPALIEQRGIEAIDNLDGDAAIAWFDRKDANTLHLARYQHSPLVMCQVEDGSFIFCSTEALLWRALIQLDLMPVWMETANELDYFTIVNGVVTSKSMLPEPKYTANDYDYGYYRHQTAGAKGSGVVKGSTARSVYDEDDYWMDDYGYDAKYGTTTNTSDKAWYALDDEFNDDYPDYVEGEFESCSIDDKAKYEAKWYTRIYDELLKQGELILYMDGQREVWKDELFTLAQEPDLTIVDYGVITHDREYVSTVDADIF